MSSHEQISNKSWALSLGCNVVDTKATIVGGKSYISNAISEPINIEEYWNVHPSAVYFRVGRSFENNFSIYLQGSLDKIIKVVTYNPNYPLQNCKGYVVTNPGDLKYFGIYSSVDA